MAGSDQYFGVTRLSIAVAVLYCMFEFLCSFTNTCSNQYVLFYLITLAKSFVFFYLGPHLTWDRLSSWSETSRALSVVNVLDPKLIVACHNDTFGVAIAYHHDYAVTITLTQHPLHGILSVVTPARSILTFLVNSEMDICYLVARN